MEKCILYISDVVHHSSRVGLPRGLRQIAEVSKAANKRLNITGLLAYKSGHYLQVLEGPCAEVDALFASIECDSRHTNVKKLLDVDISKRRFSRFSMHLMSGIRTEPSFKRFVSRFRDTLLELPASQRDTFERFYFLESGVGSRGRYAGLRLWMHEVPELDDAIRSPAMIDLCNTLTDERLSYDALASNHGFASEEQLRDHLDTFLKRKQLKIERIKPAPRSKLPAIAGHASMRLVGRLRERLSVG